MAQGLRNDNIHLHNEYESLYKAITTFCYYMFRTIYKSSIKTKYHLLNIPLSHPNNLSHIIACTTSRPKHPYSEIDYTVLLKSIKREAG